MSIFLGVLCLVFLGLFVFVTFYAIRWAKIIFILEDDLDEAIEVHKRTMDVLESLRKTPAFSDSPELIAAVREAMEAVKVCQSATAVIINNFTQRSKQRYIRLIDPATEYYEQSEE